MGGKNSERIRQVAIQQGETESSSPNGGWEKIEEGLARQKRMAVLSLPKHQEGEISNGSRGGSLKK